MSTEYNMERDWRSLGVGEVNARLARHFGLRSIETTLTHSSGAGKIGSQTFYVDTVDCEGDRVPMLATVTTTPHYSRIDVAMGDDFQTIRFQTVRL